jgi:integrase/recombinase XerD
METMTKEIDKFLSNSLYSENSKRHLKYALRIFVREISQMSKTDINEIHLQKIYVRYDNEGNFLYYRQIDAFLVDKFFYNNLNKGYSWLKEQRFALSAFFSYLSRNYDFINVMTEITFELKKYKPKNKAVRCLSKHEVLKFFHYIVSYSIDLNRDVLLFTIFITTGCRISEIINLRVQDIYWEDNTIFLPKTKHSQSRTIPLRSGLACCIKTYCLQSNLKSQDNLFNLTRSEIRKIFHEFLMKAQLPIVNIHSLRHSFATFMSESGTDITVVQQLLGHSDLFTTKDYFHSNEVKNREIQIKENQNLYSKLAETD